MERVPEVVPGYPDRLIPKPEHAADLKKRTLTNLYNQRPTWLVNAHRTLDEAVAAAYGWPVDLSDEDVLRRAAGAEPGAGGSVKLGIGRSSVDAAAPRSPSITATHDL